MSDFHDEEFLREILSKLNKSYPKSAELMKTFGSQSDQELTAALFYLRENSLVEFEHFEFCGEEDPVIYDARITARGRDYLRPDGGLAAQLGVVTVKLHDDTIKRLLLAKIDAAEEDEPGAKAKLKAQVQALPAEATREVAMTAIRTGIAQMPAAVTAIRAMIGL